MSKLTQDEIVIDTNVFLHMVSHDTWFNPDGHVAELLGRLLQDEIQLCVDDGGRIVSEYETIIGPMLHDEDDIAGELGILRYWMAPEVRVYQAVDNTGPLMAAIKGVITERHEAVDRTFVAVALVRRKVLVSNDVEHILDGPNRESKLGPRRSRLMKQTKKYRDAGAEILTSCEAHARA